jgi:Flp pilus assembly protein TadG
MLRIPSFKRYLTASRGVVAIETAFIMPILVLLYVAMIDITNLVSLNRRMTQAASMLSDVVTQYQNEIELNNVGRSDHGAGRDRTRHFPVG